jgi:hypothetical protein
MSRVAVLDGVSWELYGHLLKVVGDRPLRLTYDHGELEIASPVLKHEVAKCTVGNCVRAIVEELDLPCRGLGSTTFRRRLKLLLQNGDYIGSDYSLAFPKLRVSELRPFIRIAEEKSDQTAAVKALRAWLRKQSWVRR